MKFSWNVIVVVLAGSSMLGAQTVQLKSSHAPISVSSAASSPASNIALLKPAVRVNDSVLTEVDVRREMAAIFPYAGMHGGQMPKELEPQIRKGALDMLIFEELLYQDAKRRNLTIDPQRVAKAEAEVRRNFPNRKLYQDFIKNECKGSTEVLREKIRRSMLIERMLKTELKQKSVVTEAEVKAAYEKNLGTYSHGDAISIQTISMIPPENADAASKQIALDKINGALRLVREKSNDSKSFGLIAEQISDDDWRTKLGDRGIVELSNLPPEIVKAAEKMKPGDVSDVIKLGPAYTFFRLNSRISAGRTPYEQVKESLRSDLEKQKTQQVRAALNQRLRKNAKIEIL